jgi:hypothetical protein
MNMLAAKEGRGGITQIESECVTASLHERAYHAAYIDRRILGDAPSEDEVTAACSSCDADGWTVDYVAEVGAVTGRCRHFLGFLALLVEREGHPVSVRKPALAVA